MNTPLIKRLLLCILAPVLLGNGSTVDALEAGAHAERLTFSVGTPLAGDPARQGRPATAEHDPLWIRCLRLDDGTTKIYLLTLDIHHIPQSLRERVVALAAGLANKENIFLTATHTGNGPGSMEESLPLRWSDGRYNPVLVEEIAEKIIVSMQGAEAVSQRATVGYGTARQQVLSANANETGGPVDEQIGVIRVDNADGQAIAVATNFAAMPHMVPAAQRYQFSADYPGAYYTAMEELTDPGCKAMFLLGAGGGQVTANPESQQSWAAIEAVGRLLAGRAKEVANKMTFRDARLKSYYREVQLPSTIADATMPSTTVLQALEIDGLLLVFLPAVPDVEIGLALRKQASALGYQNQFTVAAANAYIGNIVPRSGFASGTPEASRHPYGPDMADWLYANVDAMLRGVPVENPPTADSTNTESTSKSEEIALRGDAAERGRQRAVRFASSMRARYNTVVLEAVRKGDLRPVGGAWPYFPPMLDPTPLAMLPLAAEARPMLQRLDETVLAEVEAGAAAVAMPVDAFWLLQSVGASVYPGDDAPWFQSPMSTVVAIVGERAGADQTIIGLNLDWPWTDLSVLTTVEPSEGHVYLQTGFDWQMGAFVGMNDAGVTVAVLELDGQPDGGAIGLPIDFVLRDILQRTATYEAALEYLGNAVQHENGRVLLSGPGKSGWMTAVISLGDGIALRNVEEGLLFGVDIVHEGSDEATRERYQYLESALGSERIVGVEELKRTLTDGTVGDTERRRLWNSQTRQSVILLPQRGLMSVARLGESGMPGEYTNHTLKRGEVE